MLWMKVADDESGSLCLFISGRTLKAEVDEGNNNTTSQEHKNINYLNYRYRTRGNGFDPSSDIL